MRKETPNFVTIAGLTVATLFFWVIFSIYQALLDDADVQIEEAVLADINPSLDTASLNSLDSRTTIEEPELSGFVSAIESSVGIDIENEDEFETETSTSGASLEESSDELINFGEDDAIANP